MVKNSMLIFLICFFSTFHISSTVEAASSLISNADVSAEIDLYKSYENRPLKGTIAITHDVKAKVDVSSIIMDGKPLKTTLLKSVKMSPQSTIELSIYQFELPSKPAGLYVLSPISVKVGDQTFSSVATSYQVSSASEAPHQTQPIQQSSSQSTLKASLNVQTSIDGPTPLYPGMRTNFVYKYLFQGSIELVEENLPLLVATGFQKIGDEQAKDYQQGEMSVHEIIQEVQALTPGEFKFQPSWIEGYAYKEGATTKTRTLIEPKIKAETPEVIVSVLSFPTAGKPSSFNGAVGHFNLQTALLTPSEMHVDDKIELSIDIIALNNNLHTVKLPDLYAAGLPELFRIDEVPPAGSINENKKSFTVVLHPLTTAVKEIPSIEFSYFDPKSEKYETLRSLPIPIKVTEAPEITPSPALTPQKEKPVETIPITQPEKIPDVIQTKQIVKPEQAITPAKPAPVEIETNYPLDSSDLDHILFGSWSIFWIFPFWALIILGQILLRQYWARRIEIKNARNAQKIFQEAIEAPFNSPEFFNLLNQAFLMKLAEKREISSADINPESLPETGFAGQVREFLVRIQAGRFTGSGKLQQDQVIAEAKKLFSEKP
jgi:hypothetical protein